MLLTQAHPTMLKHLPSCLDLIISLNSTVNKEAVRLLHGNSSSKTHLDPRETHHLSSDFASMFSDLTNLLNDSVDMAKLKDFLRCYSHPLYPEKLYVHPKIYEDANTTKQLIMSLHPQYINFMHYYLLEDVVENFGCDEAKKVIQKYSQKYSRKRKLNSLPGPITDGEIEQFHDTIKLKVQVKGDTNDTTVETIGKIQKALEMAIGITKTVITYAFYAPGSVLLTFLIPESILHIFSELNPEDLAILADSGMMKLEVNEVVIDNIEQCSTVKRSGNATGLEYYLSQRAAEMTSDRHLHLLKMLGTAETRMLSDICSEEFLYTFAKDLQDWKKFAPCFSIHERNKKELACNYPDENDQKYQALLWWKKANGSTTTYYNLLECVILRGNIGEMEALLQRLGEGKQPSWRYNHFFV